MIERTSYEELSADQRKKYDEKKEEKPHWSHEQLIAWLKLQELIDDPIEKGRIDITPDDTLEIFNKFGSWIQRIMPEFYQKIEPVYKEITNILSKMIKDGIKTISEYLNRILSIF